MSSDDLDVHLIMDNYATHKTPAIRRSLAKRPRFHVHFTPTSASWINPIERWFATLTAKQIRRGILRRILQLEAKTKEYTEINNGEPEPFIWTKTDDQILESIASFCLRASGTGHSLSSDLWWSASRAQQLALGLVRQTA